MNDTDLVAEICKATERGRLAVVSNGKTALQGYRTPTEWQGIVQHVAEMQTPDDAISATEDVTLLESLLNHAHKYGDLASEYCILEAKMYVRIASLYEDWNNDDKDKFYAKADKKTLRLVNWIRDKNDEDLAWIFGRVAEGRRIEAIRKDEMAVSRKMMKQDKYALTAARLVESFKCHGETTITLKSFCDNFEGRGEVDAKTACVWIDQARKEVRKLGGVGLGGGDGKYVAITANSDMQRRDIAVAILNRLQSIEHDLNHMSEICLAIDLEPPTKEVEAIIHAAEKMVISAVS